MNPVAKYFLMLLVVAAIFGLGFRAGVRFCWDRRAKKILRGAWFKSIIKACNDGNVEAKHRDAMEDAARRVMKTKRCPACDLFYVLEDEEIHRHSCDKFKNAVLFGGFPKVRTPPGPIPPAPPAPEPPLYR